MAHSSEAKPLVLRYPMRGHLLVRNSPADAVPSHGTDLMGTTFAIDLIGVDDRGRSAPRGLRALIGTEQPERFVGFGRDVLAPCSGRVVIVHDGEADHVARRSLPSLLAYLLTQRSRLRGGPSALAGNHVVIAIGPDGPYVTLAHLRRGSATVEAGARVVAGDVIGACGNSGNSTQPHVHIQATDSTTWEAARGLPIAFETSSGPHLPGGSAIVSG